MAAAPFYRHYRRYERAVHPLIAARFRVQKSAATSPFAEFFHDFNVHAHISLWVRDPKAGTASVDIYFDPAKAVTTQPPIGFQPTLPAPPVTIVPLVFNRTDFRGVKANPCATVNQQGNLAVC
jgi:hypothetical protein